MLKAQIYNSPENVTEDKLITDITSIRTNLGVLLSGLNFLGYSGEDVIDKVIGIFVERMPNIKESAPEVVSEDPFDMGNLWLSQGAKWNLFELITSYLSGYKAGLANSHTMHVRNIQNLVLYINEDIEKILTPATIDEKTGEGMLGIRSIVKDEVVVPEEATAEEEVKE